MKSPIDKLFEAVDYYKEWREKLVRNTAIKYLQKKDPDHPLLKGWIVPYIKKNNLDLP